VYGNTGKKVNTREAFYILDHMHARALYLSLVVGMSRCRNATAVLAVRCPSHSQSPKTNQSQLHLA
jgi:hypothetical protein